MYDLLISNLGEHGPVLVDFALKATLLLTVAGLLTLCLRKASAALRHLVWFVAVLGTVALPFMESKLPAWEVTWLPEWEQTTEPPAATTAKAPVIASEPISQAMLPPVPNAETTGSFIADLPVPSVEIATDRELPWPAVVWLIGAAICLSPFLIGFWRLTQITRRARQISGESSNEATSAMEKIGLRRRVPVLVSNDIRMPLTWGFFRPVVLVPTEFVEWTAGRRELVLLHELAHIKRHDWLTQLLAGCVASFYWFHPLVWLAARQMRVEREQACDDLVLRAGSRPSDYADELLQIATTLGKGRWINPVAVPMARRSSLEGRLLCILDGTRKRRALTRWVVLQRWWG